MIKTYFRDFSPVELITPKDELIELVDNRQNRFYETAEYIELKKKISDRLDKLRELLPGEEVFNGLNDDIIHLECALYTAAYRDGMSDLMVAITLNKLNITKVEYFVLPEEEKSILRNGGTIREVII